MPAFPKEKIAVLGGGSWGSTLAAQLAKKGHEVSIWEFLPDVAEHLKTKRTLTTLPQLKLPSSVFVTNNMKEALQGKEMVLCVTPSHTVRATFQAAIKSGLKKDILVVSASKGIENGTHMRMSEIIKDIFPDVGDLVILSGPSHAEEVAMGQPVALVAASHADRAAERVRAIFAADSFRVYTSDDPIGVELGGALKNIYAVACGVVDGLSLGDNTKAALITRGLLEITRLGHSLGAKTVTFFGLSGLGDLIVTCNSKHSRNRSLGEKIGSGKTLDQALSEMTMVAEGVNTTKGVYEMANSKGVDVPIINEMYHVLFKGKSPRDSIRDLMTREVGAEMEGLVL